MKEFVKMAAAVAVGTLTASGVALALVLNEKAMTVYTKKMTEVAMKAMENSFLSDVNEE